MSPFTTYTGAVETMLTMLNTAWQAQSVISPPPQVFWPDLFEPLPPDPEKYWLKVWLRSNSDIQRSIGRPAIYVTTGQLYMQCFAPVTDKAAGATLRALAEIIKNTYTSKTVDGVRFVTVLIREMASEQKWHSHRVAAEYSFDYLK